MDEFYLKILRIDDALLLAFWAKQGEVPQHGSLQQPQSRFCAANRAKDPFFLRIIHHVHRLVDRRYEPYEKKAVRVP